MKLGIHTDLTNEAYHASEGLSSSNLKHLLKSPAHYKQALSEETEQSSEMRFGSIVHAMILEPDKVKDLIHVGEFNTRRGKDFDIAFKAGEGKLVCNSEEYGRALECVEAFRAQATTHPYLNGEHFKLLDGKKEHSFYWKDEVSGLLLKARPDNIHPEGVVVDLKTCRDASPDGFQRALAEYQYHVSAALYIKGVGQFMTRPTAFAFICIETKAPYALAVYYLSADALKLGAEQCRLAIEVYTGATQSGEWIAYPKTMAEITLPNWYFHREQVNRGLK